MRPYPVGNHRPTAGGPVSGVAMSLLGDISMHAFVGSGTYS